MSAAKILPYYTIDDWQCWQGKWELIEGIPFAMSPAPMPKHQKVSFKITQQFNDALEDCNNCEVYQAIDWQISEDTILEPDVLVVCKPIEHRLNFPPELVVEILSPATAVKDRNSKFHLYLQQKVKYYLIVDAAKEEVEIYNLDHDKYSLVPHNETFTFNFPDNCFTEINFADIWT